MNNFIQLHSTSIIAGFLVDYITMRICTASAELACRGEDAFSSVLNQLRIDRPPGPGVIRHGSIPLWAY